MADIPEGTSVEVQGSGTNRYTLEHKKGVYSCTCPAWRNQRVPIEQRTCKHLRAYLGDAAETTRVGATARLRTRTGPPPKPEDPERRAERRAALERAIEHFPRAAARMKEVYGLLLPRHLAYAAGFFAGLSREERKELDDWGGGGSLVGVLEWFTDRGLEQRVRADLDGRLQFRYRADPPEMITILSGNTDGLHWGLWYDDPAELPRLVVHNYARDSAETWPSAPTTLAMLEARRKDDDADEELAPHARRRRDAIFSWLDEVHELELDAHAEEGIPPPPPRDSHLIGGMDPVIPGFTLPSDLSGNKAHEARAKAYRTRAPIVTEWIERARTELAAGNPGRALFLGRELHWVDADEFRAECTELLVGAYRALGRDPLAEIARAHHEHRDLSSVDVYEPRPPSALREAILKKNKAKITAAAASAELEDIVDELRSTDLEIIDAILAQPSAHAAADETIVWHLGQLDFWSDYTAERRGARAALDRVIERAGVRGRALEHLLARNDAELQAKAVAHADLAWRSARSRTVLHVAARAASPTAVSTLLDRGADPLVVDQDAKTAYDLARDAWQEHPREANAIFTLLEARGGGPVKVIKPIDPDAWDVGAKVTHAKFGEGVVESLSVTGGDTKLAIKFEVGTKTLLAKFVTRV